MANLDWSQCPAVESVPERRSGEWVFRNTRMPVATVFENLELGTSINEIIEQYDVTREQIQTVLEFAARSFHSTVQDIKVRNANINQDDLQSIVDAALHEVRVERRTKGRAGKT